MYKSFNNAAGKSASALILLAFVLGVFCVSLGYAKVAQAAGPAAVNLLSAGNFAILTKTGISDTGSHTSVIKGNIGSSPITAAAVSTVFCSEITGLIYGVDAAYVGSGDQSCFNGNPPIANKTLVDKAVLDMGTAYANAAGRTNPTATELGAGNIGGMTLAPGLYKWGTGVSIPTNVTLSGSAHDVWIFQIAGNLSIASAGSVPAGVKVILAGGAKASNVFWQVGGVTGATLGTYSTFNGNILSAKEVIIQTGAVLNGRALSQTQVTLDSNAVSIPPPGTNTLGVTSIDAVKTSATADGTFANGWTYIFHITVPTNEPNVEMRFANWLNSSASSTIPVAGNMRISSAQASSSDTVLLTTANTYSSPSLHMVTDLDPFMPGIQTEVKVEVAVPVGTPNDSYTTSYGVQTLP